MAGASLFITSATVSVRIRSNSPRSSASVPTSILGYCARRLVSIAGHMLDVRADIISASVPPDISATRSLAARSASGEACVAGVCAKPPEIPASAIAAAISAARKADCTAPHMAETSYVALARATNDCAANFIRPTGAASRRQPVLADEGNDLGRGRGEVVAAAA